MPVTKETYSANATWTFTDAAALLRDAFIDAGLMTDWYDSFTISGLVGGTATVRVLKIEHDDTKTYGSSFYVFYFIGFGTTIVYCRVNLASGWNASGAPPINVPTGTQYLDYERLPSSYSNSSGGGIATDLASPTLSPTSNLFLDRYTSQDDSKQSWFVWRQASGISTPFTILHPDTVLHPWLNLDQGMISGVHTVQASVDGRAGIVNFRAQENLRRCLLTGTALRGLTSSDTGQFHNMNHGMYSYAGLGSQSASFSTNTPSGFGSSVNSTTLIPVGRSAANPAFTSDYIPICTELPWCMWSPTLLANDFGVYMHYADNNVGRGDRFIVQSALNEWEVIARFNNTNVNDGATATFLARII